MTKCILTKEAVRVDTPHRNAVAAYNDKGDGLHEQRPHLAKQYGAPLGNDRLLTIADVSDILGVCSVTASAIMKDTGRSITIGRRVYILESNFLAFLREIEG